MELLLHGLLSLLICLVIYFLVFNKKSPSTEKHSTVNSLPPQEKRTRSLSTWIREQNTLHHFARHIKDGTTVYFSDEFAAAYDLRIIGWGETKHTIVIQQDFSHTPTLDTHLLELSIKTWTGMDYEVWYLDKALQWVIVANKEGRKRYAANDLIQSKRIDFEFTLNDVL